MTVATLEVNAKGEEYYDEDKDCMAIFSEEISKKGLIIDEHSLDIDEMYQVVRCLEVFIRMYPQERVYISDDEISELSQRYPQKNISEIKNLIRFRNIACSVIDRASECMNRSGKSTLGLEELINGFDALGNYGVSGPVIQAFKEQVDLSKNEVTYHS